MGYKRVGDGVKVGGGFLPIPENHRETSKNQLLFRIWVRKLEVRPSDMRSDYLPFKSIVSDDNLTSNVDFIQIELEIKSSITVTSVDE
jgi:hypothetical protein